MRDLSNSCIFSGKNDNLNTTMVVTMGEEKYKVAISVEYEDQATLAIVKEKVKERLLELDKEDIERKKKVEDLKKLASELGFDLGALLQASANALVIPKKTEPSRPDQAKELEKFENAPSVQIGDSKLKVLKNNRNKKPTDGLSPEEVEKAYEEAKSRSTTTDDSKTEEAVDSLPPIQYDDVTIKDKNGKQKSVTRGDVIISKRLQTVKGRDGIPTTIPRSLQAIDGETTISIVDTGGEKAIKKRTDELKTMRDRDAHGYKSSDAYYSRACRPCQGTGFHAKKVCKACNGLGFANN